MPDHEDPTGYDVIGDVHGHGDALSELLASMDYVEIDGVWTHAERQAIFVGDLIDRGPKQIESVGIARSMVEAGSAQIVLGNHEFNAVAYATPDGCGGFLRKHSDKNVEQHRAFIDAVGFGSSVHCEMIEWFKTIPLWLDLGGLRVVHACWSSDHIDLLRPLVGENDNLTDELVVASSTKGDPSYDAIETILKGPEMPLGNGYYLDKDSNPRDHARIAWWKERGEGDAVPALIPSDTLYVGGSPRPGAADEPSANEQFVYDSDVPVIFGHYWRTAKQGITSERVVCVDYSVAKSGQLVAYRWDGEQALSACKVVGSRRTRSHRVMPLPGTMRRTTGPTTGNT